MNLVIGILGPLDASSSVSCEDVSRTLNSEVSNNKLLDNVSYVCYYSNHKPNLGDLYPFVGGRK
jgi:hypothetical protein